MMGMRIKRKCRVPETPENMYQKYCEPSFQVGIIVMKDRATVLLAKILHGLDDLHKDDGSYSYSVHPDAGKWTIPMGSISWGQSIREAAIHTVKEVAGLEVDAKQSLFVCEILQPEDHRIAIFCLATPTGEAELKPGSGFTEVKWADVRDLGRIQQEEGMSDFSADAFVKFSIYLKAQITTAAVPSTVQ
jgi:ADP-ribose pyrophosphatase YjhB (NUDIX family)